MLALSEANRSSDLYLIPVSHSSGQPTGPARRLTRDGRDKYLEAMGGDFGSVHFMVLDSTSRRALAHNVYALDLESGKQTLVIATGSLPPAVRVT